MTDRELLEKAVKAAGIGIDWDTFIPHSGRPPRYRITGAQEYWNPLTDDGDALRLAVKCGIGVLFDLQEGKVTAYQYGPQGNYYIEVAEDQTPSEATRRAIVRAAASIGETP